jgi:DNA-binding CsgD family transcriptional regulator
MPAPLSRREYSIVECLLAGATNDEIATILGISPKTVEFHLTRLYARFEVPGRTALAVIAMTRGWVSMPAIPSESLATVR